MLSLLLICANAVATTESEHLQLAEDTVLLHASVALASGEVEMEPPEQQAPPPPPGQPSAAAVQSSAAVRSEDAPPSKVPTANAESKAPKAKASTARASSSDGERLVYSAEIVPVFKFVAKPDPDAKGTDAHYLVLLDGALEFKVPALIVYLYPVILCATLFFTWLLCCFRSDRSGFSCRLAVEAVACFPCLWAELATKYKAASACRSWTYVYALMALLCTWSACATFFESKNIIRIVFYSLLGIFWAVFTYERVSARKVFRSYLLTESHTCSDCAVTMCCAPMSAMQEAHIMATVEPPQPGTKPDAW